MVLTPFPPFFHQFIYYRISNLTPHLITADLSGERWGSYPQMMSSILEDLILYNTAHARWSPKIRAIYTHFFRKIKPYWGYLTCLSS